MNLFDSLIREIRSYVAGRPETDPFQVIQASETGVWPTGKNGNLVLLPDLGMELGHPGAASVSFLVWTDRAALVNDGHITIMGPDIREMTGSGAPLGKVVIAGVEGLDETSAAACHRRMHLSRFDVSLEGFMIRSASRYMAEWWRISRSAVQGGFSLACAGAAQIRALKRLDYVKAVEVLFVTASDDRVQGLYDMGVRSVRTIEALTKMVEEMTLDCADCEYQDVCGEAGALRELRRAVAESGKP